MCLEDEQFRRSIAVLTSKETGGRIRNNAAASWIINSLLTIYVLSQDQFLMPEMISHTRGNKIWDF